MCRVHWSRLQAGALLVQVSVVSGPTLCPPGRPSRCVIPWQWLVSRHGDVRRLLGQLCSVCHTLVRSCAAIISELSPVQERMRLRAIMRLQTLLPLDQRKILQIASISGFLCVPAGGSARDSGKA